MARFERSSLTAATATDARGTEAGRKAEAEPRRARRAMTVLNMVNCSAQRVRRASNIRLRFSFKKNRRKPVVIEFQ